MSIIERIEDDRFDSVLELPTPRDPGKNATLTVILRYKLGFADGKNRVPGVITMREGSTRALDGEHFAHYSVDWDEKSRTGFTKAVQASEKIWDRKFILTPSLQFDGLDFPHPHPGWYVRPMVICQFRMEPRGAPHVNMTAVRLDSNMPFTCYTSGSTPRAMVVDDQAPWQPTLGHELGHALGMEHIKVMMGDRECLLDPNADRCYGETPRELNNIMGHGRDMWQLNARPWRERIARHTGADSWGVTLDMTTAPWIGGTGKSLLDI